MMPAANIFSLIGQLEQKKRLTLDSKVRYYLPGLHFNNDYMNDMITLRDMLCHRTGLSRYERSWLWFNTTARDSLLARIQYMKPTAGLREKWQYNNFMYMALGQVAEELTGKSLGREYFSKHLYSTGYATLP